MVVSGLSWGIDDKLVRSAQDTDGSPSGVPRGVCKLVMSPRYTDGTLFYQVCDILPMGQYTSAGPSGRFQSAGHRNAVVQRVT